MTAEDYEKMGDSQISTFSHTLIHIPKDLSRKESGVSKGDQVSYFVCKRFLNFLREGGG